MRAGLSTFARRFLIDDAGFRKSLVHPVLVWEGPPGAPDDPLLFGTAPGREDRPAVGEGVVFEVVKSKSKMNAFAMGVTLGRTDNNDVIIEDNSVSRFHGYFQQDAHRWKFIDAESSLGTFINGKKLAANKPVVLPDIARMKVGQVELFFFIPATFIEYLQGHIRPP